MLNLRGILFHFLCCQIMGNLYELPLPGHRDFMDFFVFRFVQNNSSKNGKLFIFWDIKTIVVQSFNPKYQTWNYYYLRWITKSTITWQSNSKFIR